MFLLPSKYFFKPIYFPPSQLNQPALNHHHLSPGFLLEVPNKPPWIPLSFFPSSFFMQIVCKCKLHFPTWSPQLASHHIYKCLNPLPRSTKPRITCPPPTAVSTCLTSSVHHFFSQTPVFFQFLQHATLPASGHGHILSFCLKQSLPPPGLPNPYLFGSSPWVPF